MKLFGKGVEDAFAGTNLTIRCYESHTMLKIGKGSLYGGSAYHPVKKDADIYIVLQSGDAGWRQTDPWEDGDKKTIEVQYAIKDMEAPANVSRFKKMITWLCNQLHEGKTVHVGCIGGHGRTGTVLSAIVAEGLKKKDAIQYVRKHYCEKAVESNVQLQFLMKHYGVSSVTPTKEKGGIRYSGGKSSGLNLRDVQMVEPYQKKLDMKVDLMTATPRRVILNEPKASKSFGPMSSDRSIWKASKKKK